MTPTEIVRFWADEVGESRWFVHDSRLDFEIKQRFSDTYALARAGQLDDWAQGAEGALALLLLFDQFPRNMFRGCAHAFATDAKARDVADHAIARDFDLKVPLPLRCLFYLPFSHAENMADQERGVALVAERLGSDTKDYAYAVMHRDVIARFGRFPGRNVAIGRQPTAEEAEFLKDTQLF